MRRLASVTVLLALFATGLNLASPAFAQPGCSGQMVPLKPLTPPGCGSMEPACVCAEGGLRCAWQWSCVGYRTPVRAGVPQPKTAPAGGTGWTIPLQAVTSPERVNLLDLYMQAQQIRLLREQTRQQELINEELERQRQQANTASQPATPSNPAAPLSTGMYFNGRYWLELSPVEKMIYLSATMESLAFTLGGKAEVYFPADLTKAEVAVALDEFYAREGYGAVPIVNALGQIAAAETPVRE